MRTVSTVLCFVLVLGASLVPSAPSVAAAQDAHDAALVLRILAYDRNLRSRARGRVTLLVVYRGDAGRSQHTAQRMASAVNGLGVTVAGMHVRAVTHPFSSSGDLLTFANGQRATAMYVCPGLTDATPSIAHVARTLHLLSVTTDAAAVHAGLSVGVISQGSRTRLLVNLRSVAAEGARLDSGLLGLADVIR